MQILNRTLTEQERSLINGASNTMAMLRVFGLAVDIFVTIAVLMILQHFRDSLIVEYLVTSFYIIIALGLLFVISQQQAWCYNTKSMTDGQIIIAMSYGNSAIGWPFGGFSILYTTANIIMVGSLIYTAWIADWYALVAVIATCFVFTNLTQYFRGRVLLVLLDEMSESAKSRWGR